MDESRSKKLALKLLAAVSTGDVDRIMESDAAFGDADNWHPYGGQPKNWDRVHVQTSEPVGAMAELLINSIDAILTRKAKEQGLSGREADAPKSMVAAVRKFFPGVPEGKIARLEPIARTKLAEQSVLVGVKRVAKRHIYPTYTIADFGEGQNADVFHKTLLSLGEKNKEGIPFVQGRFNMGSTGSIVFCTQAEIRKGLYKFILSKRTLSDSDGNWGWTLIRTRSAKSEEDLPVVEYFRPGGAIAKFLSDSPIRAFERDDIGVVDGGTIIKLYEYDIGPSSRAVDLGLDQGLTVSLLECALPIRIYDFDAKEQADKSGLRTEGITGRTFSGMKIAFSDDGDKIELPSYLVAQSEENLSLGKIRIYATGIKELSGHMKKYNFRCFYTVNGQAQAKESASILRKAKLDDLQNHIIVQVDCNEMDKTARSAIFKPDRQRMSDTELSRELRRLVIAALAEDGALRDYARKIRQRRVTEAIQDDEKGKDFWDLLLKNNPELKDLFGMGGIIVGESDDSRGDTKFKGKQYPTVLNLLKPKDGDLAVPVNTYRRIECQTDAENDYLGRSFDPGEFFLESSVPVRYKQKLRNGKLRITVWPPDNAQVGDSVDAVFGFRDSSRPEPLKQTVKITYAEEAPTQTAPPGENRETGRGQSPAHSAPEFRWVDKSGWGEHGFDEESGAHCSVSEDGVIIYLNMDNKHLRSILKNESDESEREMVRHFFKWGVGILTLSIDKKFSAEAEAQERQEDWRPYVKIASSAISAHVVTLIRRLGGQRK